MRDAADGAVPRDRSIRPTGARGITSFARQWSPVGWLSSAARTPDGIANLWEALAPGLLMSGQEQEARTNFSGSADGLVRSLLRRRFGYSVGDPVPQHRRSLRALPNPLHRRRSRLAEADLWREAAAETARLASAGENLRWLSILVNRTAAARLDHAGSSSQPLLTHVLAGEYGPALDPPLGRSASRYRKTGSRRVKR